MERTRTFSPGNIPGLLTLGRGSRLLGLSIRLNRASASVLIGHYSVIEEGVALVLGKEADNASPTPSADNHAASAPDGSSASPWGGDTDQILIGSDVKIGRGATLMGGIAIGNGAVVQPGAVVKQDVPPYAIVPGSPAQTIQYRFPPEVIEKLLALRWWDWPKEQIQALEQVTDINAFLDGHPLPEPAAGEHIVSTLRKLKRSGRFLCFFSPSLRTDGADVCRHVLEQFVRSFHTSDAVALIVELDQDSHALSEMVQEITKTSAQPPVVAFCAKTQTVPVAILRNVDGLVTTRSARSLSYWTQRANPRMRRFYGLNETVFGPLASQGEVLVANSSLSKEAKQRIVEQYNQRKKDNIAMLLRQGILDKAMQEMLYLAHTFYHYNQFYTDDFLEDCLQAVTDRLREKRSYARPPFQSDRVLFYDAFGLDTRGLAQIYLEALGASGRQLLYLVPAQSREKIPTLEGVAKKYGAEIVYYHSEPTVACYETICQAVARFKPQTGFLYTTPWDVAGILAFMHFEGVMTRYMVNLTDHAYWLGRNAFDYCLESRNYGAYISSAYRKIPREKLLMLPFYPALNQDHAFGGYPFQREPGDFVIFSGGALYKTMDENHTFYRIVAECLARHPQVKFWYAGKGDDTFLKELMAQYPGRVFHTAERRDLFELLRHVDMYLNTCPLGGGLMMQYAAMAGRPPLTLRQGPELGEILIGQESLGIESDTPERWQEAISRFITDPDHRAALEKGISRAVIRPVEFQTKLRQYIESPGPGDLTPTPVDTAAFRQGYLDRFLNKISISLPASTDMTRGDAG